MNLLGQPELKFRTKEKLHICKEPGFISWATVAFLVLLGVALDYYLTSDNFITQVGCVSVCLLIGLTLMEEWEDFVIDREENLITIVNRSWYHGISTLVPEENIQRFSLNIVTAVKISPLSGIDIMKNDGTYNTIVPEATNNKYLRKLRKEISTFLHLERMEDISGSERTFWEWDIDPWSLVNRDSQESDNETQEINASLETSFEYGRNIKIISGPAS